METDTAICAIDSTREGACSAKICMEQFWETHRCSFGVYLQRGSCIHVSQTCEATQPVSNGQSLLRPLMNTVYLLADFSYVIFGV